MPPETICCICLDSDCNYLTDCCENKIHKSCIVNWFIYKGIFECPLCRSTTTRVPIHDLLTFSVKDYAMSSKELSTHLNNLLQSYNLSCHITINIPEERNLFPYGCTPSYYRVRILCRGVNFIHCRYLLIIPLFYLILFYFISNVYIPNRNNIQYLDNN